MRRAVDVFAVKGVGVDRIDRGKAAVAAEEVDHTMPLAGAYEAAVVLGAAHDARDAAGRAGFARAAVELRDRKAVVEVDPAVEKSEPL